jgi:hypothetical protein
MNGEIEHGIERFGGGLEWRPRPTPGCSAIEEEEEEAEEEPTEELGGRLYAVSTDLFCLWRWSGIQ